MKKLLSFALALLFVVTAFASVSVSAEAVAPAADPLDANLIIHYDFEGEDILEAMKDKAPAGSVKDDLSPIAGKINFSGLSVDIENGTITNTAASAGVRAVPSDDTRKVTGASTWFTRAKIEKKNDKDAVSIIEMRTFGSASNRPFGLSYNWSTNKIIVAMSSAAEPSKVQNFGYAYTYDFDAQKYINIAIVVDQAVVNEATVYQLNVYISTDLPQTAADWTHLGTNTIGAEICPPNERNNLDLLSTGSANCGMTSIIDDVRLYDKALTLEEIATIIPNGSFEGQLKERPVDPEETDETPADTNAAPAETTKKNEETTEAPAADSSATSNAPATEAKGCGATVSIGVLSIVTLAGVAMATKKKRT